MKGIKHNTSISKKTFFTKNNKDKTQKELTFKKKDEKFYLFPIFKEAKIKVKVLDIMFQFFILLMKKREVF